MDAVTTDASSETPPEKAGASADAAVQQRPTKRSKALLVVLLLILLGVVWRNDWLPDFGGCGSDLPSWAGGETNTGRTQADIQTLETCVIRYRTNMNSMPASLENLTRRPDNRKGPWRKLIEESALTDQWGQPYQYSNPGKHNAQGYDIFSKGPDMKEDTDDDIGNWQN